MKDEMGSGVWFGLYRRYRDDLPKGCYLAPCRFAVFVGNGF